MTEKRKPSTRNRGERPVKKPPATPTPSPKPPDPIHDGLPVKLKADQELPTLPTPQSSDLSTTEYQTISESGVLASSIDRSRQTWLTNGIFERYWAKPSKKRIPVDAQNPSKDSMTKLGGCSMIIEPHVFDITLYTVRERPPVAAPPAAKPPTPSQLPSPDMRYSSFPHVSAHPSALQGTSAPGSGPQTHREAPLKQPQPALPPFKEGFAQFGPQAPPLHHNPFAAPNAQSMESTSRDTVDVRRTSVVDTQSRDEKSNTDPVIQMLATRAASNNDLKALMKVVASGNASQDQLVDFQTHIDELNAILKARNESSQTAKDHNGAPVPSHSTYAPSNQSLVSTSTLGMVQVPQSAASFASSKSAADLVKQEHPPQYFSHYTQPPKSKGSTAHKLDISAIVFDLGGSGDRFLFPRFSILEYLAGGTQVVASFLVIRKGSAAVSKWYKDTASYYQPVTIRLTTSHHRILEPLTRVVAPADEVRRYMNSIFDKMSPAEKVFLATRLPRTIDSAIPEKEDQNPSDSNPTKLAYSPPSTLAPRRRRN